MIQTLKQTIEDIVEFIEKCALLCQTIDSDCNICPFFNFSCPVWEDAKKVLKNQKV